jgi:hypothetical protein
MQGGVPPAQAPKGDPSPPGFGPLAITFPDPVFPERPPPPPPAPPDQPPGSPPTTPTDGGGAPGATGPAPQTIGTTPSDSPPGQTPSQVSQATAPPDEPSTGTQYTWQTWGSGADTAGTAQGPATTDPTAGSSTSAPLADATSVDLTDLGALGAAIYDWIVLWLGQQAPPSPLQSGPDPGEVPGQPPSPDTPQPDVPDQPDTPDQPPSDVPASVASDPIGVDSPVGDPPGNEPPPIWFDPTTPKGDPSDFPVTGSGGPPPQWPGWGGPLPGDPLMDPVGLGDPGGLGLIWDTALGAAAAASQVIPSAAAQIQAAIQAWFAQHGIPSPTSYMLGAELLASLPPGMSLEQYLQLHQQYQPGPGQTYARVTTLGPNDPGSIPEDPLGPIGLGGGGTPSGGGGGYIPTSSSSPDDPRGGPEAGNQGTRPDPGPSL